MAHGMLTKNVLSYMHCWGRSLRWVSLRPALSLSRGMGRQSWTAERRGAASLLEKNSGVALAILTVAGREKSKESKK